MRSTDPGVEGGGIPWNRCERGGGRRQHRPPWLAPNPATGRAREEAEQGRRARAGLGRKRRLRGQFAGGCVRAAARRGRRPAVTFFFFISFFLFFFLKHERGDKL
ncbi:hypothetical protein DAI22_08g137050 [Oryza sativa Japonica Group]|nr:hypothetical protein DAI22_08g137050 [Oryza sativa Japonica Group]